ncbi:MAG: cbb3-type cytochrome c oxidase subunit I [Leptospiraceae bacterium]|nr:cbb3-type cytochrome c oxidase subunit I [Leptospiraceae bacterium]
MESAMDVNTTSYLVYEEKKRPFPLNWLLSVDHKRIGVMYAFTMFTFFAVAVSLGFLLRLQKLFPQSSGWEIIPADMYGSVFTLHAIIMIFLFIVPGAPAILGNFFLPLQIGAKDVAFPRVNLLSYWLYLIGAIMALAGVLVGGADTGWTFTVPYSVTTHTMSVFGIEFNSVSWMLTAAFVLGWGTILTGINFIVTVHRLRAKGMGFFRMPLFTWSLYATSWLQVLATPVVGITLLMVVVERFMPIGFFDPNKGGDPILFQHLFWIYSHPAVYIMILPSMGLISEIIPTFSQKPIFGYKSIALATCSIAGVGYLVWAHHMFTTGISDIAVVTFSFLTFLVGIPTAIKVFNWIATMYRGSIRLETPMLYAIAFIYNFMIGGLTGLLLGNLGTDIHLHDTDFVVGHFHYTMFGGGAFGIIGGIFHYWSKMTGKQYSSKLGNTAFTLMFIGFQFLYMPLLYLGMNGMPRRYHTYPDIPLFNTWQFVSTVGSWVLVAGVIMLFVTWIHALWKGKPTTERNPWNSSTLEWQTLTPPPLYNFAVEPVVTRDPYDYEKFRKDGST